MYDGERADIRALEQLESILREVGEELALWRARALKAEGDLKGSGSRGHAAGGHEPRGRMAELEAENRQLRTRVEAAKARTQEMLARLAFLEEQTRDQAGAAGGGSR